ncbi:hypothetical protein MLD38_014433 [Melastoma candidum]|uniref:Uncharacterized protein n=1 Tax=Melastoma candidum TaxID=119954 RepID=A0ACB9RGG6_9MYRT|nr:hypothetical protein MLD38_014433 [Melastoma candidum]
MSCVWLVVSYRRHDPCLDISMDLEPHPCSPAKATSLKSHRPCNGEVEGTRAGQGSAIPTLMGCLDSFTRPERFGSDQKLFCQQCQMSQGYRKQMSIRKLPLVSCFHIKQFEQSSTKKMYRKIDRYMHFPFSLDMTPYLSFTILRRRFGNRVFPLHGPLCDLRLSNRWYKCDDAWITQVNDKIVMAAQGYLMFYVQKIFWHKVSDKMPLLADRNLTV